MPRNSEALNTPTIDAVQFALEGLRRCGSLGAGQAPRLRELTDWSGSEVRFDLRGMVEHGGGPLEKKFLLLVLEGHLMLQCQRCLEPMKWPLQRKARYWLIFEGEPWPDEEMVCDEYDATPASRELAIYDLIEEEILLSLPMAPCHEERSGCRPFSTRQSEGSTALARAWNRLQVNRSH